MNNLYSENPIKISQDFTKQIKFHFDSSVGKEKLFDVISDVKNYPIILRDNYESVKIVNNTENEIIAEEVVKEKYLKNNFLVKHIIFPYEKHVIEILDGDAKDTKIVMNFQGNQSSSIVDVEFTVHLKGNLSILGVIVSDSMLEAKVRTILETFEKYAASQP